MEFTHHQGVAPNAVTSLSGDEVRCGARAFRSSIILAAAGAPVPWTVRDAASLTEPDLVPLLELRPELVLLGSGPRQVFPPQRVFAALAGHGIGLEVMDNGAACRTFNLLLQEGRDVVVALIFP